MKKSIKDQELLLPEDTILVSKTDKAGKIFYANREFMAVSGYSEKELVNQPHNMIRHPDMPRVIFKMLWEYLNRGTEIHAYVKNLSKDGSYYWVLANVFPILDKNDTIISFHSSRRKPAAKTLEIIKPLYRTLMQIERQESMEKSETYLRELLQAKKMDYDEFILSI